MFKKISTIFAIIVSILISICFLIMGHEEFFNEFKALAVLMIILHSISTVHGIHSDK
jgi:uncharacterized membrane protein